MGKAIIMFESRDDGVVNISAMVEGDVFDERDTAHVLMQRVVENMDKIDNVKPEDPPTQAPSPTATPIEVLSSEGALSNAAPIRSGVTPTQTPPEIVETAVRLVGPNGETLQ